MTDFRLWLDHRDHPAKFHHKGPDDLPVVGFNTERMIDLLSRREIGFKKGFSRFTNECQWGENPGAVRVIVTPKVNLKIQRLHADREGTPVWLMKRYFFIDDGNFAGREDVVAAEVFDEVSEVNDAQMENVADFDMRELAQSMGDRLNGVDSSVILSGNTIKQTGQDEWTLLYYLRGGGVGSGAGASASRGIMEVVVNLSKNKNTGLIKAMVSVVNNTDESGNAWTLSPCDFEEYFLPTQGKNEIIDAVATALKTY